MTGAPDPDLIVLAGVSHWYRPRLGGVVPALRDCSLRLAAGGICGLIGPNGSGKSTLLKLAAGLAEPRRGTVRIGGLPATHPAARRRLGFLPESPELPDWLKVGELMAACGELAGLDRQRLRAAIPARLEWAGLGALADRSAAALSTGQRRRLGLAQALLHEPEVLLLDEPAAGLDPVGVAELTVLLRQLRAAGTTVLMSSHFLRQLEGICDRVCLLAGGRLVWSGKCEGGPTLEDRYLALVRDAPPEGTREDAGCVR